jgi:hypothetical protein
MDELWVRCGRCHEVFDANVGPCTKCGTPYRAPVEAPKVDEGSFIERYLGTEYVEPLDLSPAPVPTKRRGPQALWIGAGFGLLGIALVVVMLMSLGVLGGSAPTEPPLVIIPVTPKPSPTPTLPASVSILISTLNDRDLSAHVTLSSRVQVSPKISGKAITVLTSFDGQISGADESGILKSNATTRDIRFVDNSVYVRILPSGKWQLQASIPPYLILTPLFGLTKPEMIELVGEETKDGRVVDHFRSTRWWLPDSSRLAMTDVQNAAGSLAADVWSLDIWATPEGVPVSATFTGTNKAFDGTMLLDIAASYTFDQVGVPVVIGTPDPSPTTK